MTERPNYYAIIPANIRYDNDLSDKAKLLYGEIAALTDKTGYCWATNGYFAKLYNVSKRTITRIIKQLEEKNYITTVELEQKGYRQICLGGIDKNVRGGIDKNVYHNNTRYINTRINNNKKEINKEKELFNYDWLNE